ncbi:kinase-like protein [Xylaria sp. FL0043]|nr:kinase-like protein [Xylaria sp. FL0043]
MASELSLHNHTANSSKHTIVSKIRDKIYDTGCDNDQKVNFFRNNELDKLFTRDTVSDVVASMANRLVCELGSELPVIVDQILPRDQTDQNYSRKRILAILILGNMPDLIIDFIKAEVWDRHLPLQFRYQSGTIQLKYNDDDGSLVSCPFPLFGNDFGKSHIFDSFQWDFIAPIFTFTDGTVHHYSIQHRVPLPFTEQIPVPIAGGNSQVSQVVIHHGHHDLTGEHRFAVKRLLCSTDEDFNKEVKALKLVRNLGHSHLVELLGTFEYRDSYYLIFHWAVDDLAMFWKKNASSTLDPNMSLWALQQCLGIAEGLQLIHGEQRSSSESNTLRGRHGDIKPTNILRYVPIAGAEDLRWGLLKISDFGLTRFHQNHSYRREYTNGPMATRTYRAPEGDLRGKISYLWDLWSLGCLYLEFLTWLLQGWDGVAAFSEERKLEDQSPYDFLEEDKFFNMDYRKAFGACRKDSVRKHIDMLHGHPDCTAFMHDFLDLISDDMIRIREEDRAKCHQVVLKLEAMKKKCEGNVDYYTKRMQRFAKSATYESDKPRKLAPTESSGANANASGDGIRSGSEPRPSNSGIFSILVSIPTLNILMVIAAGDSFALETTFM